MELLNLKELCPYSISLSWKNLVFPAHRVKQELFLQAGINCNFSASLQYQYIDCRHTVIITFGSSVIYTWLISTLPSTCDNSLQPASQAVRSATYWMLQLFSVLLMCLIVSLPLFQDTWRLFKWECLLASLHESSILLALSKVIFFSTEVPETPKRNFKKFFMKNIFSFWGKRRCKEWVFYIC